MPSRETHLNISEPDIGESRFAAPPFRDMELLYCKILESKVQHLFIKQRSWIDGGVLKSAHHRKSSKSLDRFSMESHDSMIFPPISRTPNA